MIFDRWLKEILAAPIREVCKRKWFGFRQLSSGMSELRYYRSSLGGCNGQSSTTTTKLGDNSARLTPILESSHGWRFEFLWNFCNEVLLNCLAPLPTPRTSDCYDMSSQLPANVVLLLQLLPISPRSFFNICLFGFQIAST